MRAVLIGGAGFIGRPTAIELKRRGHEVTVVGRGSSRPLWVAANEMRYTRCDVADSIQVSRLFEMLVPEIVLHLAWFTNPNSYLSNRIENVTSLGAGVQVLAAAERAGCARLVLGGTCLEDPSVVDETVYGRMKHAMHQVAAEYVDEGTPQVTCAHIFSVYGPAEHPHRAIPSIIRALSTGEVMALTDGRQLRDYLHVDDVACALATVAESTSGGQIDICSGSSRPLRDVFSVLGQILGREDLLRFGAAPTSSSIGFDVHGDPTRITELGWSPRHTLESGLRSTVEWWINAMADETRSEH